MKINNDDLKWKCFGFMRHWSIYRRCFINRMFDVSFFRRWYLPLICMIIFSLVLLKFDAGYVLAQTSSITTIAEGDEWHYFKGIQKPPSEWKSTGFDDSQWQKGPSGLGYGVDAQRTHLGDMKANYSTLYARRVFSVNDINAITGMNLSILCDGPFVANLNGIEILRTNTVQDTTSNLAAGMQIEQYSIDGFIHELFPHENVLSIKCSNDDINSDDFYFLPVLKLLEIRGVQ